MSVSVILGVIGLIPTVTQFMMEALYLSISFIQFSILIVVTILSLACLIIGIVGTRKGEESRVVEVRSFPVYFFYPY